MKDILVILRRNLLSPIVIAILVLASILLYLGESRDAWFVSVLVVVNSSIAIIQEVRVRKALRKLELLNAPRANRILPNGKIEVIPVDQLCEGDKIRLNLGDEVPADGKVIVSRGLELDESILTGESAPIGKPVDANVYAASAVSAGSADVLVVATGLNTKMGSISKKLKRYIPQPTPLQIAIRKAITWLTYGALVLAVLIFGVYYWSGQDAVLIFKTITSAAVAVIPEGLMLASTLLLAFGSLKLASVSVLPQKLAAIEAMALLNVLCVDKTGTLTSDEIKFEKLELFNKSFDYMAEIAGIVAKETGSGSLTSNALIAGLPAPKGYDVLQNLPFSSERKMSGIQVLLNGKRYTCLMGAPDFLNELAPMTAAQRKLVKKHADEGKRVMLVAEFKNVRGYLKDLKPNTGIAVGLVIMTNELREGVEDTVNYLQQNGVSIRVISGDSPDTVRYIAARAGIKNADNILTGAELAKIKRKSWDKKIAKTTIFARVLPEQKERIIATFRRMGHFTGMVGDGVNDALAVKKADLGVVMYAGAATTRRIADVVLLNNSFNSLPVGMRFGNRIIQAIEIIATLFFHKITYGVILLFITMILGITYPFLPRHLTFMNIFLVTMPTIMWTLFPPSPRYRVSPRHFWRDTLMAVSPIAGLSGITVTMVYAALNISYPNDPMGVSTAVVILATFFGVYLTFLVPKMLNVENTKKAKVARILYMLAVALVVILSFSVEILRDFFDFSMPVWQVGWPIATLVACVIFLQWQIARMAGERLKKHELLSLKR